MKKILVVFIILISTAFVHGQENTYQLNSLSLSSGEGALSSGLFFEAIFNRNDDIFGIYLGERDICVYYLKPLLNQKIYIGPSWEYFFNTPTFGLMLMTNPYTTKDEKFSLSTFTWSGISAGTPLEKVELLNWRYLFFYNSIELAYKNLSINGAVIWYDTWGHLFEVKYSKEILQNLNIFTSAGYSWYQDGKYLFKFGMKYQFN